MEAVTSFFNELTQQVMVSVADPICNPAVISLPVLSGLDILSVQTHARRNYSFPSSPMFGFDEPITGLNFCNVTVTYTHPGWGDTVNVYSYLPFEEEWNGRFLANGGGGFSTGGEDLALYTMLPGMMEGFAASTTDGGHRLTMEDVTTAQSSWAHSSPGNVNWPLLVDFAYVALHDMATIGKAVTEAFYGSAPRYSYFFGGSTGGRQGHMLAQRYPKDFDGILGLFPAINWTKFLFSNIWPVFVMNQMGAYPPGCQFDALREKAIAACDGLDGIEDGIIAQPAKCHFDPHTAVGQKFDCMGTEAIISSEAATIAQATWNGPRSSTGEFQWYGFGIDANLTSPLAGSIQMKCTAEGKCSAKPFIISATWIKYWILKDADFDLSTMTHKQWDDAFHASMSEYDSVIGTHDPDLSTFKAAGGKMLNWHGTGDQAIPYNGSVDYYDRVLKQDTETPDYYRLFIVPGSSHSMTTEVVPSRQYLMKTIQDWVERGIAPDTLASKGPSPKDPRATIERNFCMYPQVIHYIGGDQHKAESFVCV